MLDSADQPTDEQIAYAEQVAAFAAENPAPVAPEGSDKAELNAFALEQLEYLESVPWEAVTGQWGCAVDVQEPVLSELGGDGWISVTASSSRREPSSPSSATLLRPSAARQM